MLNVNQNLKWIPAFSTGNAEIDKQHLQLLSICSEVESYSTVIDTETTKRLLEILDDLQCYIKQHFDFEESLLRNMNHGNCHDHQQEHAALFAKLLQKISDFSNGCISKEELHFFLHTWVNDHILESDRDFKFPAQQALF